MQFPRAELISHIESQLPVIMNLKTHRVAGMYKKDGKFYPGVTTILQIIAKPALMFWAAEEAYYATVKNPQISVEDAKRAHIEASSKAKNRGSAVHSIIEAFKKGNMLKVSTPELTPYLVAFQSFVEQYQPHIVSQEQTLYSDLFNFAGTFDLIAKVGDKIVLIDVKTNKDGSIYPESTLQLSAYKKALHENHQLIDDMAVLCLASDGTFTYKTVEDAFPAFLAAKTLWEHYNKEKVRRLNGK